MESKNLLDDSWQVGDRCYAIYSGDDLWYPAILKKKERNKEGVIGWIVFYEGHDDEEWRSEDMIEETDLFEDEKTERPDNSDLFKLPSTNKKKTKKQKKEKREKKKREHSVARSHSRPREPSQAGLKDETAASIAKKLDKQGRKAWEGLSGEGDQRKSVHLVKWMNTGKKRMGTHNKR